MTSKGRSTDITNDLVMPNFITFFRVVMGHDISLELREHNLMTKLMLKQEEEVIEHLKENKFDVTEPINQVSALFLQGRWEILSCIMLLIKPLKKL